MKKLGHWLHEGLGYLVRGIMRVLVALAFRPQRRFASEAARQAFPTGPCVIVSNHVRAFDGAAIEVLLPRRRIWGMTAKDLLEKSWPLRTLMGFCRMIPIDREHFSMSWLREGRKRLKAGDDVYMCPEGRCQKDHVIREFKPGFVTLAASAGVPVVPICHNGMFRFFFGKRFRMIIGEPISLTPPPEGLTEAEMARQARLVEDAVRSLEAMLKESAQGRR